MKALSVKQPWAELIASGAKPIEVRSVPTHHRGQVAIHSSLKYDGSPDAVAAWMKHRGLNDHRRALDEIRALPAGRVVAIADLNACHPFFPSDAAGAHVEWRPNAWAWRLAGARRVTSVLPVKGQLGLWNLPDSILQETPA